MLASVLLVDKPKNLTSFQVVETVRKKLGTKVGHTGTLDPLATGLLILVLGEATRYASLFTHLPKTYVATAKLGEVTDTYDAQGTVLETRPLKVSCEDVKEAVECLKGEILQKPPAFSAKKVKGKRAYHFARKGQKVELKSVKVYIHRSSLIHCRLPYFSAEFEVSSGTYVRSLIHDMGLKLGCGAHLTELRRTKVGRFDISMAVPYEKVLELSDIDKLLVPVDEALDFLHKVSIPISWWEKLKKGGTIKTEESVNQEILIRLYVNRTFVGVGKLMNGFIKPYRLLQGIILIR